MPAWLVRMVCHVSLGGAVFVLGLGLQWTFVVGGMSIVAAYTLQLILTTVIVYGLNRRITWNDRRHDKKSVVLFVSINSSITAAIWVLFTILTHRLHVQHLVANGIATFSGTMIKYAANDLLVFQITPPGD